MRIVAGGRDHPLLGQWLEAVAASQEEIEEPDQNQIDTKNTWEEVEVLANGNFSLLPSLYKFKDFMENLISKQVSGIDLGQFWGLCRLVIKVANEADAIMRRLKWMVRDIARRIANLRDQCQRMADNQSLEEMCMQSACTVLIFFADFLRFVRQDDYESPGDALDDGWRAIAPRFHNTIKVLDDNLPSSGDDLPSRIGDLSLGHHSPEPLVPVDTSLHSSTTKLDEEVITPRYQMLPPLFRVPRFFNRDAILLGLDTLLEKTQSTSKLQSLIIYGVAGVGKSSIALHYAERKWELKQLDALFWIHADNLVSIKQSFTKMAIKLGISDDKSADDEENASHVFDWLSKTTCRWLLIYDNVESKDIIQPYWPRFGSGRIIITARDPSVGRSLTTNRLEIPTWDAEAGTKFLYHLLSSDIQAELRVHEASATDLSRRLGGHALAISVLAGVIDQGALSIPELSETYKENPGDILDSVSEGNRTIGALWDLSFKSLTLQGQALLGVLAYMAPDSIPQEIFTGHSSEETLPPALKFCTSKTKFLLAKQTLLSSALIKVDTKTQSVSLHRLVQDSYKRYMTLEQRQQSWTNAARLLCHVFPKKHSETGQMYQHAKKCNLYLEHVLIIADGFLKEKRNNSSFQAFEEYCGMNTACGRFLLEINKHEELEELLAASLVAWNSLPKTDLTLLNRTEMLSYQGQVMMRLGRPKEAMKPLLEAYDICLKTPGIDGRELAWGAEHIANATGSQNQYEEAIGWHNKAHKHWADWSDAETGGTVPLTPILKRAYCLTLIWAGPAYTQEARSTAQAALEQIESAPSYNWAMAAYIHFILGTLDWQEREYLSAEAHFMDAQNKWNEGNERRTNPFVGSCLYRLGCAALDNGRLEAAINHLKAGLEITSLRKATLVAEHARCLFKLSEALEQEPRREAEARSHRDEAETLIKTVHPTITQLNDSKTYDDLVNVIWR